MKPTLKKLDPFSTIITRLGLKSERFSEEQKKVIEELAQANEKLFNAEKMKSNFLSNIRNEINNPITSILELSQRIADGKLDEEGVRKYSDMIYSEAFNLDFQMRNIITAAEIESGEVTIAASRINVYSIIFNTLNSFKHLIVKKDLKLEVNNSVNKTFSSDPEKLEMILRNLIANAIEFNKESASIEITSRIEREQLIISIADKGEGIDDEKKELMYNRFRQLEEGVTKSHKGQGLGLSLVKSLLELINGTLKVDANKDSGSVFTISLFESKIQNMLSSESNGILFDTENEVIF